MDESLQSEILGLFHRLPPGRMLLERQTLDQANAWGDVKRDMLWLHQSFKDFFEGRGQQKGSVPEHLWLHRNLYLKFYQVIQWGWGYIRDEFEEMGFRLPFKSPGDALLAVIELESIGRLAHLNRAYYRFSPNEKRDLAALDRKIEQRKALGQAYEHLQKRYTAKIKTDLEVFGEFVAPHMLLISICAIVPKSEDRALHGYLREYRQALADLDRWGQSQMHQRHRLPIVVYRHGQKEG